MKMDEGFWTVHSGLPRQGPGLPEDVFWAVSQLPQPPRTVCDVGSGPGADTVTLAQALPNARIEAIDLYEIFVAQARQRLGAWAHRVSCKQGDMADILGPYDLIWCAGAIYFLGVPAALKTWKSALSPRGAIAFSAPVLDKNASSGACEFWQGEASVTDLSGLLEEISAAGYVVQGRRRIVGPAWAAYYTPMAARLAQLSGTTDPVIRAACDAAHRELTLWRENIDEIAYQLFVVTPR